MPTLLLIFVQFSSMFTWKVPWYVMGLLLLGAQLATPVWPQTDQWLSSLALGGSLDTFAYAVQSGSCFMSGIEVVPSPAWCQSYTQQVQSFSTPKACALSCMGLFLFPNDGFLFHWLRHG